MKHLFVLFVLFGLFVSAAPGAQDSEPRDVRARLEQVPLLAVKRIEIDLDPSLVLGRVSAVAVDAAGGIHVLHRPEDDAIDPVLVLDEDGELIRSFGAGMFELPHGIRVDDEGRVWTVDAHTSRIIVFSPEGERLREIEVGDIPDAERRFCGAADVAFADDGHVLVADGYCNGRVVEYDAAGRRVAAWGEKGTGPGQFDVVHSIAMSPEGEVYVADRENGRLQRFDRAGGHLGTWTYGGQLFSVAFSPSGDLYVGVLVPDVGGQPPMASVVRLDRSTGQMLGRVDAMAHELAVSAAGELFPAGAPEIVKYRNLE